MSSETPHPYEPPTVQSRTGKPPGVLPRHTQPWVIGGIALVMVLVIAFSGSHPPKKATTPETLDAQPFEPDQTRIQEYRRRIDEQAKRLAEEQARLAQVRQAAVAGPSPDVPATVRQDVSMVSPTDYPDVSPLTQVRQELAAERIRREQHGLFASNLVMSRTPKAPNATPPSPVDNDAAAGLVASGAAPVTAPAAQAPAGATYPVVEGTVLEAALVNRLDGAFSGPVKCLVTTNVFSPDRLRLLIPQGTEVLGQVRQVDSLGQQRLALTFHRLIRPDGYSVDLDAPGLDQAGATGLRDKVNHHYVQIFGVSLAVGAIAGFSQANTGYGTNVSSADVYRQGVASSLAQSSLHVLDRFLNVLPTFTIREGSRVKVFLMADLHVPVYVSNQIPLHRRIP